jgi:hypothetical protein
MKIFPTHKIVKSLKVRRGLDCYILEVQTNERDVLHEKCQVRIGKINCREERNYLEQLVFVY